MDRALQKISYFLARAFSGEFVKKLLLGLLLLVLFGFIPDGQLVVLLVLFVICRALFLLSQIFFRRTEPDWKKRAEEIYTELNALNDEQLLAKAVRLLLPYYSSRQDIAKHILDKEKQPYLSLRENNEIISEFFGLVGFSLLLPLNFALYTEDFVSPWAGYGYLEIAIVVACIGLYFLPHQMIDSVEFKKAFWFIPFLPLAYFAVEGIDKRHPYLNIFHPDIVTLRGEKILSLRNNALAGKHSFWIYDYAHLKEQQGDNDAALKLYYKILQLSPNYREARIALDELQQKMFPDYLHYRDGTSPENVQRARAPLWDENTATLPLDTCTIDNTLGYLPETTIVIVPFNGVDDRLVNILGSILKNELKVGVCRSAVSVPLPEYGRYRGLVFGKQWDVMSLAIAASQEFRVNCKTPVYYLYITDKDIYSENGNFVFSTTYEWGGIMSYHRLDENNFPLLVQRAGKQALRMTAIILGAPVSTDPLCVTSFSSNLEELDAKGNRPNQLTLQITQDILNNRNRMWKELFVGKGLQPIEMP